LLGVLLAGIVAMQVEVLKLNATMGRSLERGTALASRNQQLRASVAALSDAQRIERLAAHMGMVMPAPTGVSFLPSHQGGDVQKALGNIHAPDAAVFVQALPPSDTVAGIAATAGTAGTPATAGTAGTAAAAATASTPATTGTAGTAATSTPASTAATSSVPAATSTPAATQQSSSTGSTAPSGG
jgi:hypothetical protein